MWCASIMVMLRSLPRTVGTYVRLRITPVDDAAHFVAFCRVAVDLTKKNKVYHVANWSNHNLCWTLNIKLMNDIISLLIKYYKIDNFLPHTSVILGISSIYFKRVGRGVHNMFSRIGLQVLSDRSQIIVLRCTWLRCRYRAERSLPIDATTPRTTRQCNRWWEFWPVAHYNFVSHFIIV